VHAIHCRYCFAAIFHIKKILPKNDDWIIKQYIEQNPAINEVIFSGGDPLTLSNRKIALWIERLESLLKFKF
jgi:L-lysine 2,3-aminomutase